MGNSSSGSNSKAADTSRQTASQVKKSHHHHLLDHFHLHHHHFFNKSGAKRPSVEPEIESFFKWWDEHHAAKHQENVIPMISFKKIMTYFLDSKIIRMLIERHILTGSHAEDVELDQIKLKVLFNYLYEAFIHAGSNLLELYTDLLFVEPSSQPVHPSLDTNQNVKLSYEEIKGILHDCYYFTLYCALSKSGFTDLKDSIDNANANATLTNIMNTIEFDKEIVANERNEAKQVLRVSKEKFRDWLTFEFPNAFNGYHYWFIKQIKEKSMSILSPDQVSIRDTSESASATSIVKKQELSSIMNNAVVWYLVSNLPSVYLKNLASESGTIVEKIHNAVLENRWKLLYSSETHGLSINRFLSSLFNYKAATIMLILCESGSLYCVCSNEEYKESPTPYGDSLTKAFRLWPDFKIYDVNENNIYLNTKSKILKLGLIFGYNLLKPILKIDEHFQSVEHYVEIEQEEDGAVVKRSIRKSDKIFQVEAYGCGSSRAALDQENMKKWESKQIEKMRTAKLDAEWGENADKAILDLAGVQTEHSQRGDI